MGRLRDEEVVVGGEGVGGGGGEIVEELDGRLGIGTWLFQMFLGFKFILTDSKLELNIYLAWFWIAEFIELIN